MQIVLSSLAPLDIPESRPNKGGGARLPAVLWPGLADVLATPATLAVLQEAATRATQSKTLLFKEK